MESHREGGAEREGRRRTYMAGKVIGLRFISQNKERATTAGLLAEVYTSELGALYMEDPSWFAWHNSTVPTEEREIDGIWFGNRHTTPERSRQRKQERQRNENISHIPVHVTGTPVAAPWLSQRESGAHPPALQARATPCHLGFPQWGLAAPGPSFRSVMVAAWHMPKGA